MNLKMKHHVASLLLITTTIQNSFSIDHNGLRQNHRHLDDNGKEKSKIYDPDDSRIRFATFGSSTTWGAGYPKSVDRRSFAYPWQLSTETSNLAIRAGGPNYPANCASSMCGDEVYDVIVLEFFMMVSSGLQLLARRLRERYPDATMIFLKNWYPLMIKCNNVNLQEWAYLNGFERSEAILDPEFHELFKRSSSEWESFFNRDDIINHRIIDETAEEVGGIVSVMTGADDSNEWYKYAHLFAPDGHHLSPDGHQEVVGRIRDIIRQHGVVENPRLGQFAYSDSCEFWLSSGEINHLEYSSNGVVENMPNTLKYALKFEDPEGWIRVNNPATEPQTLYLGYMTTGPPPSKYPITEVEVVGSGRSPTTLNMNAFAIFGDKNVHLTRLVNLGLIPPGKTTVNVKALETNERPFRIVSVIVTTQAEGENEIEEILPGGNEK